MTTISTATTDRNSSVTFTTTSSDPPLDTGGAKLKEFVDKKVGDVDNALTGLNPATSDLSTAYETKTNELKNQLNLLRDGNSGVWTSVADAVTKSVTSLQNTQLYEGAGKAYKDNVDPIYAEIANYGADPVEFLRRSDVAKVTADDLPARSLAQNTQNYMRTLAEVVGGLGNMWKETGTKLQSDPTAQASAKALTEALTGPGNQVVQDNKAAYLLHVTKNDTNGRTEADDALWSSISGEYAQFSEDARTTFRADAATGEVTARDEILTALGKQDAALYDLLDTTKANQAMLDGQNLPIPKAEDNLLSYGEKLNQFLSDLSGDFNRASAWSDRVESQSAAYMQAGAELRETMKKWGWSLDDLRREDPSKLARLEAGATDLAQASASLMDAQKAYADRVDEKAKAWREGWESTKKKEAQKTWVTNLNGIFDLATSMGIAGDSIVQIATKGIKALKSSDRAFKDVSQFLGDASDPLDLIQAAINTGIKMNSLKTGNLADGLVEFDTTHASIGHNLSDLVNELHKYYDEWDSRYFDPGEGSNW